MGLQSWDQTPGSPKCPWWQAFQKPPFPCAHQLLCLCPAVLCAYVCVCQGHVDVLKFPCLSFLFHHRQAAGWGDGE